MRIVGIDPGNEYTAYCIIDTDKKDKPIVDYGKMLNEGLLVLILRQWEAGMPISMEHIVLYGNAGNTTRDTLFWIGRFYEFLRTRVSKPNLVFRRHVAKHFLGNCKNKGYDAKIRGALIKRYEPSLPAGKRPYQALKGITKDVWSALAIAVYTMDTMQGKK
jgi:hypothetical protein